MPDRESVIKGLEPIIGCAKQEKWGAWVDTLEDAVALLTETVKPKLSREWFVCECGASITVEVDGEPLHKTKFCCECGKGLDWS